MAYFNLLNYYKWNNRIKLKFMKVILKKPTFLEYLIIIKIVYLDCKKNMMRILL